jgi:hypothetical protein
MLVDNSDGNLRVTEERYDEKKTIENKSSGLHFAKGPINTFQVQQVSIPWSCCMNGVLKENYLQITVWR